MACKFCQLKITGKFDIELSGEGNCYFCSSPGVAKNPVRYEDLIDFGGAPFHKFTLLEESICPACGVIHAAVLIPCSDRGGFFFRREDLIRRDHLAQKES